MAFAITRYAGVVYGITQGLIYNRDYREMLQTEVTTGIRTNPPQGSHTLPNAYFHLPQELTEELEASGLQCLNVLGVLGPAWLVPEINQAWSDPEKRSVILEMARLLEHEAILGPRLLAVGKKHKDA